ncbi:hypothetical protein LguiB_006554 [Lonicera macranthoides]
MGWVDSWWRYVVVCCGATMDQSSPKTRSTTYSMAIVRAQEAASLTFKYNYQVFLSFRGPDTRKTFTDHLYTALVQAGLRTFIDDNEIERGKRLELELGKAIQQSRISIIVLSKNYASSKWCLNEVLMILEWSRTRGHEVLPVFYDVNPSDGTESIEVLMLDMRMYKDDASNVIKRKQQLYDESHDTFLPSNQGNSLRRHYFNFISSEPSSDVGFNYDAFSRMDGLRLLKLNYAKLSGRCEKFPKGLRCLCWHGFPLTSIPFDLPLENLVSLDMSYSKLECVWARNKVLLSLKILNLSHSQRLLKTPNFIGLPNLEILILNDCVSLFEVCDNIGNLERLSLLNLKNCKSLRKFPNIGKLKLLQTLVLHGCTNIGDFPMDLKNMVSLKMLNINGVTTKPLTPTRRDDATLWQTLFQPWLSKPILKNPQDRCISLPCSLVTLSLRNCNLSDDDFPLDFSNLPVLQDLDLGDNLFLNLPRCVHSLRKLSCLGLTSCKELISISGLPNVKVFQVDDCRSLESITYQSALTIPVIHSYCCGNLRKVEGMFKLEPLEKVNKEILDNLSLWGIELIGNLRLILAFCNTSCSSKVEDNIRQGLYEFGIFSTFLRREEIPSWCGLRNNSNSSSSSSVSFVVPSHPNLRLQGLNVYSVYKCSGVSISGGRHLLFTKINNKTKDLEWIYPPMAIAILEKENEEEELVWLSHWKFGNQLESGDGIDVLVISDDEGLEVKEFGIKLVWGEKEENEEMKARTDHHDNNTRGVVGGDLSDYQFMSPRAFFLCHHFLHLCFTETVRRKRWFREVFGDHVTFEGTEPRFIDGVDWTDAKLDNNIFDMGVCLICPTADPGPDCGTHSILILVFVKI